MNEDEGYNAKISNNDLPSRKSIERMTSSALGKLIDEYFKMSENPTISGLALHLGFCDLTELQKEISTLTGLSKKNEIAAKVLRHLNIGVGRVKLYYEESLQTGKFSAQSAKFVLEVLGFTPAANQVADDRSALGAATAAKSGAAHVKRIADDPKEIMRRARASKPYVPVDPVYPKVSSNEQKSH